MSAKFASSSIICYRCTKYQISLTPQNFANMIVSHECTDIHVPGRDSNPQFQHASGRGSTL